ncbi:MAG: metallophosphoesterase [Anaerovoracaceae bacterium]
MKRTRIYAAMAASLLACSLPAAAAAAGTPGAADLSAITEKDGLTRAQYVSLLAQKQGVDPLTCGKSSFLDVPAEASYAGYIGWAAENGIVIGTGGGIFMPEAPVTDVQIGIMQERYGRYLAGLAEAGKDGGSAEPADTAYADSVYDVMLSVTEDSSCSATLTWHDEAAGRVHYGTSADRLADTVQGTPVEIKSGIDLGENVYSAVLTGLSPDTEYYYCVEGAAGSSSVHSFRTAGEASDTAAFLFLGDIQFENSMADEYGAWGDMVSRVVKQNPDVAFGLQAGDIVQNGIRKAEWEAFFDAASPVFSGLPLMTANGNHESNVPGGKPELYLDLMSLPQNGPEGFKEEFYSFDYGSCHVTVLNSWVFSGEQILADADYERIEQWISEDLGAAGDRWKIVMLHHPAYAVASDLVSESVLENWVPILEKQGADLVLCGHQHVYARSLPLKAGVADHENGIVYVMGNSGKKFYSSADETLQEKVVYGTSTAQVVRISGDCLEMTAYDSEGREIDYFTVNRHR